MPANKENWTDYMWQKQPICPHCDKKIDISNDDFDGLYDEDSAHWFECPFCEHEFRIKATSSWVFSTADQRDWRP